MTVAPPNTKAQLSHAVVIKINRQTIGAINEWNPKQSKTITELYELGNGAAGTNGDFGLGNGEPFEKVPGNVSGMQIEVRRYDIYTKQMELVLGTTDLTMLSNQDDPFECREGWAAPSNVNNYYVMYLGCWFSDLGRTISSTGDRTVNVNATIHYTRKERVRT